MKLYVFTKKDIDRFLIECNFTPDEERLFRLRCKEYTLEYCAEQMNVSISTAKAINADTVANMQNTNALQAQLANCCCETREAIQGINYNMAQNTCALQNTMNSNTRDIIDSQNAGTRAILDYLCNEKISNLQAENNDLRRAASQDRQSALLTTAMASQTQQLINAINPAPIPAYQVPNPNTYYGCGCNTGCNC